MTNVAKTRNTTTFGLSLPDAVLQELDTIRGDVNRSRYILRLIENSKKRENAVQIDPSVRARDQSIPSTKGKGIGVPKPNG